MIERFRRMFSRRVPAVPPTPPPSSTLPALARAHARQSVATPRHNRVMDRSDAVLALFGEFEAEAEFMRNQGRHG